MRLIFLGLSITSSWGNGHATTYRSLIKALSRRGHSVVFFEREERWYREHRDFHEADYCTIRLYDDWRSVEQEVLRSSQSADATIIGSYVADGRTAVASLLDAGAKNLVFYDIDTPITLAALDANNSCAYLDAASIRDLAAYLSFTGGPALLDLTDTYRARRAIPLYCSVDLDLYQRLGPSREIACDLSYLGTYAPDRQAKLEEMMLKPALALGEYSFTVAGSMYPAELSWPKNVRLLSHVPPSEHSRFYSSCRFTLNLTRKEMIKWGFSPSVRLFEAAACGATIISDNWKGIETFFTPGSEILIAEKADKVTSILSEMDRETASEIGNRAQARVRSLHSSDHRAGELEDIISQLS